MAKTNKPMSGIGFKMMKLMFKFRDLLSPRMDVLKEAEIESGATVLDFGCGPGGYIMPLAELVGASGKIFALDIHPLAVQEIKHLAMRNGLENIEAIESECSTGLPNNSVDTVLLYDVFHDLARPDDVLQELYRILKTDGKLSFSDHHLKEKQVLNRITETGLFQFLKKGDKTYTFAKSKQDP